MSGSTSPPAPVAATGLSKPARVAALAVNAAFIYVGVKKGGWWHILTFLGVTAGIYNVHELTK
jgi:hypothetical protein